jgi:hypothetical protein
MAENSGTGELMKSKRFLGVSGFVLMAAFALGTSAQASTLSGSPLSADGSLSMADSLGTGTNGAASFAAADVAFDACAGDDCSETEEAAVVTPGGGAGASAISHAAPATPEPASFVLVGLALAVLPLVRKRRS